jgi:hypothetical protein
MEVPAGSPSRQIGGHVNALRDERNAVTDLPVNDIP